MKKFNFYEVRDIRELLRHLDTDTDDENEYCLLLLAVLLFLH